jgi:hypothetical protein
VYLSLFYTYAIFSLLYFYLKFLHKVLELQINFNYDFFNAVPKHNFKNIFFFSIFTVLNIKKNIRIYYKKSQTKKQLWKVIATSIRFLTSPAR